jgi:RNA polymerase sigma factor (sigma-70 family)
MKETESRKNSHLWNDFLEGDDKSFALLYTLYINRLLSYGYKICPVRELVHDSVQEVFLDLFLKRGKTHHAISDLKGYLFASLKHSIMKKLVRQNRQERGIDDPKLHETFIIAYDSGDGVEEKEHKLEIRLKLLHAIDQLTPREKEIIYLRFEEELDYVQISRILGITVDSCYKEFSRAMKDLRLLVDRETFISFFVFFQKKY